MVPLSFANHDFQIAAPAALFWPQQKALLVADLHLEKASFYARQGQMLPPYDSRATLDELSELITKTNAETVFCLGDNYHDDGGEARLETDAATLLRMLTEKTNWIWISGNHDRGVSGLWGGMVKQQWCEHGLTLRHEASRCPMLPEISGHYHPKIRVPARGRHISRRCFVRGQKHLIMPAFGSLTGGMAASDPVIEQIVEGPAEACIGVSEKLLRFPLPFTGQSKTDFAEPQLPLAIADR